MVEISLRFEFLTTNKQAEHEAVIAGITLVEEMGAKYINLQTDSQLAISQIRGKLGSNNIYYSDTSKIPTEKLARFKAIEIAHVSREGNTHANILF